MITVDSDTRDENIISQRCWKFSYLTTLAIIFIEFFRPNLIFILLYLNYIENLDLDGQQQAIWIIIIFLSIWQLSNPFVKKICERIEIHDSKHKCIYIVASKLLIASCILPHVFQGRSFGYMCYGIMSGISMSLLENQLEISCFDEFQSNLTILKNIKHISNAFGLMFITAAINYLIATNGFNKILCLIGFIVVVAFIGLNGLILSRRKLYRTYAVNSYATSEHLDDKSLEFVEMNATRLSDRTSESSQSLEEISETYFVENTERYVNRSGVEILPQIREESDVASEELKDEDFEDVRNARLQESTNNSVCELYNIQSFNDIKYHSPKDHYCCLSPYAKFKCKKGFRMFYYTLYDHIMNPICISFKTIAFYQILIANSVQIVINATFFFKLFYLTSANNINFYLPLTGFGQLIYLLLLPWNAGTESKRKLVTMFGLCMALNILVFGESFIRKDLIFNANRLTITNCIFFGITYGYMNYKKGTLYKQIIGMQNWKYVWQNLQISSAILVLILFAVINEFYRDTLENDTEYLRVLFVSQISSFLLIVIIELAERFGWHLIHNFNERRHLTLPTNEEISYI